VARLRMAALGVVSAAVLGACSGSAAPGASDGRTDSAAAPDASSPDASVPDAGTPGAGPVTPSDPGPATTSPPPDAGPRFGGVGPWPLENRVYAAANGLDEGPVVATSTDEAENLWAATPQALYLLRPGTTTFVKYTIRDGLHLQGNPVLYPFQECGGDGKTLAPGEAAAQGISTIVGGAEGEVFVGYWGADEATGGCADPPAARHSGKLDRVQLRADGGLRVDRFDLATVWMGLQYWHNRSILRMVYDHQLHPHTLYVATNHGVDMVYPDQYRDPLPGEWPDMALRDWLADHLHVAPCRGAPCPIGQEGDQLIGWWRGLALAPDGDLWHAGRWAAGKIRWVADLHGWQDRAGAQAFAEAFGDPYPGIPPVFDPASFGLPAVEGTVVSLKAVTATDDGTAWFGSGLVFGDSTERHLGIASYRPRFGFTYFSYRDVGLAEDDVEDMVSLPDGRLVLAGPNTGIVFYDPLTTRSVPVRAGDGIPDDHVTHLEVDRMVDPPALLVSTRGGLAVLRTLPAP